MKIISGPTARLAQEALVARLYEDGGYLASELRFAIERPRGRLVVLAKENDQAIGVTLLTVNKQIMAYVSPTHRCRGVGQSLVSHLVKTSGLPHSRFWALWGNEISVTENFWHKCRIALPDVIIPAKDTNSSFK